MWRWTEGTEALGNKKAVARIKVSNDSILDQVGGSGGGIYPALVFIELVKMRSVLRASDSSPC